MFGLIRSNRLIILKYILTSEVILKMSKLKAVNLDLVDKSRVCNISP